MRWLALGLLIANGVYFVWLQQVGDKDAEPDAAPLQVARKLELIVGPLEKPVEPEQPVVERKPRPVCWELGPFAEMISVKQVWGRLHALGIELPLSEREIENGADYWLHIPPLPTREQARALLKEMQREKIDSFLIAKGELKNGISLGMFREQERAENLHQLRKAQGYHSAIKRVPKLSRQYWLLFDGEQYGPLSKELWLRIQEGNNQLKKRKKYCDVIASQNKFD